MYSMFIVYILFCCSQYVSRFINMQQMLLSQSYCQSQSSNRQSIALLIATPSLVKFPKVRIKIDCGPNGHCKKPTNHLARLSWLIPPLLHATISRLPSRLTCRSLEAVRVGLISGERLWWWMLSRVGSRSRSIAQLDQFGHHTSRPLVLNWLDALIMWELCRRTESPGRMRMRGVSWSCQFW